MATKSKSTKSKSTNIFSIIKKIYSILHSILSFFAIFVAFKCNNGFSTSAFFSACCCPHIYLIYILATKGYRFCI